MPDEATPPEIDFSEEVEPQLAEIDVAAAPSLVVHIPLQFIGSANSYLDICQDIINASWAVETIAAHADAFEVEQEDHSMRLSLTQPKGTIVDALKLCGDYFASEDDDARRDAAFELIITHEENLPDATLRAPQLADWYLSNLVFAANDEWRCEHPEYFQEQLTRFPERRVEFFKSARSTLLGGESYAAREGWLLKNAASVDGLFDVLGLRYRLNEFVPSDVVAAGGAAFALCDDVVASFPLNQYVRSRICAGLVHEEAGDWGEFNWLDRSFTLPSVAPDGAAAGERCFIHPTGTVIVVEEADWRHVLFDVAPLPLPAVKIAAAQSAAANERLAQAAGMSATLRLDWTILSDDDFELLCYDIIYAHPKFDSDTIRKLGKSHSRDGGRDLEVCEPRRWPHDEPRKWIFQCKLIKSKASLGASKVTDIGDMLERYKAGGFGIMTSTLIDATLYDKANAICGGRKVEQLHFSALELEKALNRNPVIRKKYFP